ncbi:hypothetical protein AUJ14_04470 [Candidatus Micrarchaeota archaeon CG1_02_55_22]|nr:MAG: hypothetical protein AUJ14_04470 [Candidatus Micrarchaeota archaeon CG1_02_55_22]
MLSGRKRGQAFETMMLVISVIVALAILGVLINVIYSVVVTPGGSLDKLMQDQLKAQVATGYGCSVPAKSTIKRGTTIFAQQVRGNILELNPAVDKLGFKAASDLNIGSTGGTLALINAPTNKLSAAGLKSPEAQIYFVVCVDTQANPKKVRVCLGSSDAASPVSDCNPV